MAKRKHERAVKEQEEAKKEHERAQRKYERALRKHKRASKEQMIKTGSSARAKRRRLSQQAVLCWPGFGETVYLYIYIYMFWPIDGIKKAVYMKSSIYYSQEYC